MASLVSEREISAADLWSALTAHGRLTRPQSPRLETSQSRLGAARKTSWSGRKNINIPRWLISVINPNPISNKPSVLTFLIADETNGL